MCDNAIRFDVTNLRRSKSQLGATGAYEFRGACKYVGIELNMAPILYSEACMFLSSLLI